ncbi:MAG: complex I NDUFA9 subunit family protein [Parvularculaceae bacterium]
MAGKLAVVFGGSGFIGRHVVRELAKRGWRVRAAVRRPHLAHFLRPLGVVGQVQLAQANIRNEDSVREALRGADAVVNLVGVLFQNGRQRFDAVQAEGADRIARLAREEGINVLVHVSAIGADAESDSKYARTKAEGEAAVREAFPSAVILRPSVVFGQQDRFFNRFASMAKSSPITPLPLFGSGKTRFQPVYVDDVADAVSEALVRPDARGRTFELGGPRVYTFRELMTLMLHTIGRKRVLAPIPFFLAPIVGMLGELVGLLPIFDPPITRDQIKLLKKDNVVGASGEADIGTLADLGVKPKTVESILPDYMVRYRKYGQFAPRTV